MSVPTTLDPAWLELTDRVARRVLGRSDRTGASLAAAVRRVSDVYTRRSEANTVHTAACVGRDDEVLAARLRFFLPRDLPKIAGPIHELAWAKVLPDRRPMRVLDVGAGLGTTSLGVLDALRGLGHTDDLVLEITAVDADAKALSVFTEFVDELDRAPTAVRWPRVRLHAVRTDLGDPGRLPRGPFDLVVAGLVLNELVSASSAADPAQVAADLLRAWASRLDPEGSLIVLEPALATTSRVLHAARDRLLGAASDLCVFAPCTHAGPCPMLERARDWCHEDEPVALPAPLASVARAAGLRFEGLTFSYLTVRRDGRTLGRAMAALEPNAERLVLRVVGGARPTKGKTTILTCGEGGRRELVELRRDVGRRGVLAGLRRGDVVSIAQASEPGPVRLGPASEERVVRASSSGPLLRR